MFKSAAARKGSRRESVWSVAIQNRRLSADRAHRRRSARDHSLNCGSSQRNIPIVKIEQSNRTTFLTGEVVLFVDEEAEVFNGENMIHRIVERLSHREGFSFLQELTWRSQNPASAIDSSNEV